MKQDGLRALVAYVKLPRPLNGPIGAVADNAMARAFNVAAPNHTQVMDITDIRSQQRLFFLVVLLDLFDAKWSAGRRDRASTPT